MNSATAHALRLAACLFGWVFLALVVPPARAQPAANAAAPSAEALSYQDRYSAGGSLAPDISVGDDFGTSDTSGLARSIRADAVASVLSQQGANAGPAIHENGIVLDAQWETSAYGAWSADAAGRIGADELRASSAGNDRLSFSLHQRAMPFDDGWQTDNGLGDLNTPLINLARLQPRFMLTSGTMLGFSTEWRGP